jgi:hypothetical protein
LIRPDTRACGPRSLRPQPRPTRMTAICAFLPLHRDRRGAGIRPEPRPARAAQPPRGALPALPRSSSSSPLPLADASPRTKKAAVEAQNGPPIRPRLRRNDSFGDDRLTAIVGVQPSNGALFNPALPPSRFAKTAIRYVCFTSFRDVQVLATYVRFGSDFSTSARSDGSPRKDAVSAAPFGD